MSKPSRKRTLALLILLAVLLLGLVLAWLRAPDLAAARAAESGLTPERDTELVGHTLGLLAMLVPLCAVALAFITREVVSALCISLFFGHMMRFAVGGSPASGPVAWLVGSVTGAAQTVIGTAADPENAAVIILCIVLGGLVAVIGRTGAFQTLAARMVRRIGSPRQACLTAEALGVAVFFDDYANSLIVGPVMRPITDRLGVSREKLAYLVDSTAAPISSIAVISSWVATEVAAIRAGLLLAGVEASAYSIFIASIPYNFYNILALLFIFLSSVMGREYGPMLKAEMRARGGQPLRPGSALQQEPEDMREGGGKAGVWVALVPILVLCAISFAGFFWNGYQNALAAGELLPGEGMTAGKLLVAFGNADTVLVILVASIVASLLALLFGIISKSFDFVGGMLAWQQGASGLLVTVMILMLAWSLSDCIAQLGAVYFLVEVITSTVPYWVVPSLVFITCCVISFAIGSYGCMAIVVPMVIPIAYGIIDRGAAVADPWQYVVLCTACVLSGSVFGDHCSPITDTTILSSIGAGCDNLDHVKTQLPYALTIAAAATLCGTLPAGFGVGPLASYALAIAAMAALLLLVGKNPDTLLAGRAKRSGQGVGSQQKTQ